MSSHLLLFYRIEAQEAGEAVDSLPSTFEAKALLLLAANNIAFLLLLLIAGRYGREHANMQSELKLVAIHQTTGAEEAFTLRPPSMAHHLFASHCWQWAQDQVAVCKNILRVLVPECRCFLDVDNLETIAELELHVR